MNKQDRDELIEELLYGKFDREGFIKKLEDAGATNQMASDLADQAQKTIENHFSKGIYKSIYGYEKLLSSNVGFSLGENILKAYSNAESEAFQQAQYSSLVTKQFIEKSLEPLNVLMHESIARLEAIEKRTIYIEKLVGSLLWTLVGATIAMTILKYFF